MAEFHQAGYAHPDPQQQQQLQQHSAGLAGAAAAGSHGRAAASNSNEQHASPFSRAAVLGVACAVVGPQSTAAGSSLTVAGGMLQNCKHNADEEQQQQQAAACVANASTKAVKPAKGKFARTHFWLRTLQLNSMTRRDVGNPRALSSSKLEYALRLHVDCYKAANACRCGGVLVWNHCKCTI
jgi:hypothetical protein